jgi:methylamine dehydrogenase accessory protein MauD
VATLVLVLRLVLAVVFATAGIGKLLDRDGSVRALGDFGLGGRAAQIGGTALPLVELVVALGLLFPPTATAAAVGALVLLLAFIGGISRALLQGRSPDCHCFGQIHSAPAGASTLIRNGVLAALVVVVVAGGPGPAIDTWIGDRTGSELLEIALGLVAVAGIAAAIQLWLGNRDLRRKLAEAEAGYPTYGLPVGAPAPSFSLRDLEGRKVTLESLTAQGRPVALVFVGASCGSCWVLMPHLARWQATLAERVTIVMISTGTPEQNAEAIAEHGIAGTFLHSGAKLLDPYRVPGTPTAVIVSPDGRIASSTVVGSRGVEPLVRLMLRDAHANGDAPVAATSAAA